MHSHEDWTYRTQSSILFVCSSRRFPISTIIRKPSLSARYRRVSRVSKRIVGRMKMIDDCFGLSSLENHRWKRKRGRVEETSRCELVTRLELSSCWLINEITAGRGEIKVERRRCCNLQKNLGSTKDDCRLNFNGGPGGGKGGRRDRSLYLSFVRTFRKLRIRNYRGV